MTDPDVLPLAPAPSPVDVGIVMALPIEAGYVSDSLTKVRRYSARAQAIHEGELSGKTVALVISGPGRTAARRGAELLIAGHRPRWIISAGFAGGLDPTLARNDLVLPREVIDLEQNLIPIASDLPAIPGVRSEGSRLLTVDRVIVRSAEKAELRMSHGADLVDMETSALAALSRERAIRFLSVRVISDDATEELAPEVSRLLSHTGSYRVGVAMRAIWHRPSALKDFWAMHARAMEASDRLAECLKRVLSVLPPG
jgi:adenosylhomocysteine nucleosidase